MKPLILLLLILLAVSGACAQGWQWQCPRVFGNDLCSVGSFGDQTVWATSSAGDVLWSTNSGQSWTVRNSIGGPQMKTVFADEHRGWGINGGQGWEDSARCQILYTSDGGYTWSTQYLLPHTESAQLTDITFVDSQNGWVIGYLIDGNNYWGVLLHTFDGGLSWSELPLDTVANSMSFISAQEGWLGADTLLWHTTDGGWSWSRVPGVCPGTGLLHFVDSHHGWAITDGFRRQCDLYHTTDGGQSWIAQGIRLDLNHYYYNLQCIEDRTLWVLDDTQRIFKSVDGGGHWTVLQPHSCGDLRALHPLDGTTAWVVGNHGTVLHTADGGAHWLLQNGSSEPYVGGYDMDFADLRHGWMSGGQSVAYTSDAGRSWTIQDTSYDGFRSVTVDAVDSLTAWSCGSYSALRHTTNGGTTWTNVVPRPGVHAVHVAHVGTNYVWAVCTNQFAQGDSAICRSTDGGQSWTCFSAPTVWYHDTYRMCFVDANNGWRVGGDEEADYGFITHTSDGGQTWTNQYNFTPSAFRAISFVDSLHGWACGFGILLKTVDCGSHWESLPDPSGRLWGIQFQDTLNGWAIPDDGLTYHTTDGGSTWAEIPSGVGTGLNKIDFVDRDHGWLAGGSGLILYYDGTASAAPHIVSGPARSYALAAYPNPFNPTTVLSFDIPASGRMRLGVYDITGRLVQTLADRVYAPGSYRVEFDGANLPSGIYFVRMQAKDFSKTQKLALLK